MDLVPTPGTMTESSTGRAVRPGVTWINEGPARPVAMLRARKSVAMRLSREPWWLNDQDGRPCQVKVVGVHFDPQDGSVTFELEGETFGTVLPQGIIPILKIAGIV